MPETENFDAVASRRNAIAAIVRAFAWPCVALIAMYYFSDTVDRLARGLNKASVFGIEFEKFIDETNLSDEQLEILETFTSEDILNFIATYEGENHRVCMNSPKPRVQDRVFLRAGLIEVTEEGCRGDDTYSSQLSEEGIAMRRAISKTLESAISNVIGR